MVPEAEAYAARSSTLEAHFLGIRQAIIARGARPFLGRPLGELLQVRGLPNVCICTCRLLAATVGPVPKAHAGRRDLCARHLA